MLKRILWALLVVLSVFIASQAAHAYRPFATEDAGVAGKGVAQLEMSWDYLSWKNKDKENVLLFVPIYGITDNIELSVEVPYLFHRPAEGDNINGIGDINLVGKFLILEEKDVRPA